MLVHANTVPVLSFLPPLSPLSPSSPLFHTHSLTISFVLTRETASDCLPALVRDLSLSLRVLNSTSARGSTLRGIGVADASRTRRAGANPCGAHQDIFCLALF